MISKARINATLALLQPQEAPAVNRHLLPHNLRQQNAREEFAAWLEAHPNFTSKQLLDQWKKIRITWELSHPA